MNAGPEYYEAERKFLNSRSKEEKIRFLEEMIRLLPKHKSTENQLALLKKRLAKLKSEKTIKTSAKPKFVIKKEGAGQVCIFGLTNSGKSSLLNSLTKTNVKIADHPYTTEEPKVGMMSFEDVQIQLIEIPSTFSSDVISFLHTCDAILMLLDGSANIEKQKTELIEILKKNNLLSKKIITVVNKKVEDNKNLLSISAKEKIGLEELKKEIWLKLNKIRVYTKSPGKPKIIPPLTLPIGSTVRNVAEEVHKDFLKTFKFARIFNSTKFSGQKVGLDYKVKDLDIVEIHCR